MPTVANKQNVGNPPRELASESLLSTESLGFFVRFVGATSAGPCAAVLTGSDVVGSTAEVAVSTVAVPA